MLGTLLYIIGIFTTTATQEPKNPKSNDISVSSVEDSDSILNTNEINESNNVKNDAIVDTDNTTHHVLRHQFTKKTINKFTIFLESVLETLNTFDDSDLKYFFNVFREEIKKHHYNDCKFNELLDDKYETFIINYLNELITLPAMYIRQEMMILSRKIEDELYDSNEKQLFESINLLYKNDSYSSFKNILTNLDIYGQKSRKHMDLVQIIRNGLRFLIYDHCVPNIYRHNYIDKRNISKSNTNDALRIEKYSKVNILMTTRYVKRDPTIQSRPSTTVKQNVTRKELVFEMKEPTKKQTTPLEKIQQVTSKQYVFERKTSTKTQKSTQDKIQDVTSEEFVFLTSASTKKQTTPQEKIQVTKKQKTTQENIHATNKEFVSKTTEHTKKQTTPQKKITNSGKTSTRKYKKTTIHDKFEVITNDGDINNNIITDVYDEETTTHNTKHTSKKLKQQSSHTTKNGHTSRQVYIEKDLESKYDTHKNLTTEIITMATLYPQYLPPEHHDEKQKGKHKEKHKEKHEEKHKEKHEEKHKEKHEEKHKEKHEEKHKEKHKETVSSTTDISQTIIVKPGELFSNSKSHETNEECCTSKPKGIQNKKRKKKIKQKPSTHKRHSSIEKSNENVTQESDHQDNTVLKTRQTLTHVTFKKHKPRKNNTPRKKKHHEAQYSPEPHPIEHNRYLVKPDYEQNTPDTIFPKSKFHLKHKDRQFTIEMLSIPRDNYMHKRATTDTIFPRRPKISNQIYSVINVKRVNTKEYYDYNDRGDGTNNDNAISKVTHAEKKKKIKKISTKVTVQEKRNNKRKDIKKHKTKGIKTTKVDETREIKAKHHNKESHKLKNSDNVKPKQIKRDREREKSHSSANNKKVLKGKHSLKHSNRHKHQHYDKQTTKREVTIKSHHNKYNEKLKYDSKPAVLDGNVRKTKNKSKRKHKGENKLAKGKHVKRRQILDKIKTNNSVKYIGVTYNLERNSDKQIKREYASDDQRKYKDNKYDVYAKYNEKLQYLPGDQDLNNNSNNINDRNNTVYVKHKRVHVKPSKVKEKQINNGNIDVNIKKEEDGDRNTTALLNSTISNATTTPTQSTDSKTLGINGDFLAKILSISKFVSEMAKKAYPQDNKNESKDLIDVQEDVTLNQNEERNSKVTKDTDALQDIDTIINKTLSLTVINTDINESAKLHKNYKYNTFDPNTVTPTTQITPNNFYLKF